MVMESVFNSNSRKQVSSVLNLENFLEIKESNKIEEEKTLLIDLGVRNVSDKVHLRTTDSISNYVYI